MGFEEFGPGRLGGKDILPWRLIEESPQEWRYRLLKHQLTHCGTCRWLRTSGFPFPNRSLGGQGPPVHVGRAGRTSHVRPDLGGAAGPTPFWACLLGCPCKGQGSLAWRVLAWSYSGTSCERFRGCTARGVGCRYLGEVARGVTTHGVLGDGEGARVFGREIGFWGETHYAKSSGVNMIAQGEIRDTLTHAQPRAKWGWCGRPTRCGQP
jgi:hypothetical protein